MGKALSRFVEKSSFEDALRTSLNVAKKRRYLKVGKRHHIRIGGERAPGNKRALDITTGRMKSSVGFIGKSPIAIDQHSVRRRTFTGSASKRGPAISRHTYNLVDKSGTRQTAGGGVRFIESFSGKHKHTATHINSLKVGSAIAATAAATGAATYAYKKSPRAQKFVHTKAKAIKAQAPGRALQVAGVGAAALGAKHKQPITGIYTGIMLASAGTGMLPRKKKSLPYYYRTRNGKRQRVSNGRRIANPGRARSKNKARKGKRK